MTGSGSTVVCYGSDQRPALLDDKQYKVRTMMMMMTSD